MRYVWLLFLFIAVTGGAYMLHPLLGTWVVVIIAALWFWNRAVRWDRREQARVRW